MTADFDSSFDKMFAKLVTKKQVKVISTIELFLADPTNQKLRNHALKGEYNGQRSISAGGDTRLHFLIISPTKVLFIAVGTHAQLYG